MSKGYQNYTYKGTKEQVIKLNSIDNLRETFKTLDEMQDLNTDLQNYKNIIKKHLDNLDTQFKHYKQQKQEILAKQINYDKQIQDLMKSYQDGILTNIPKEYQNNDKLKQAILTLRLNADKRGFKDLEIFKKEYFMEDGFYTKEEQLQRFKQGLIRDREIIQNELNLTPSQEYGINYAEYTRSGANAIRKLLKEYDRFETRKKNFWSEYQGKEYKGQVAEAFYRKDLEEISGTGRIDLVWGEITNKEKNEGYGLMHIMDKRKSEFMQQGLSEREAEKKAIEFINSIPSLIKDGELEKGINRVFLNTDDKRAVIALDFKGAKNQWLVTAYNKNDTPRPAYPHKSETHGENFSTSLNTVSNSQSIPQTKLFTNQHIGSGSIVGTINGLETDKQGNITGFSPEKFVLGFIGGAVGSKAVKLALDKNPNLRKKAIEYSNKAFESIKDTLQNSHLDAHAKEALAKAFNKNLIDLLDARSFIVGKDEGIGRLSKESKDKMNIIKDLSIFIKDGNLDYAKMGKMPTLPTKINYKKFCDDFKLDKNTKSVKNNKVIFNTPIGNINIYLPYAYNHFAKNGKFGNKKENRNNLTGALKDILAKPLFVTKDDKGAFYFYKPFKDEKGILDIISVSVKADGKIEYKTTYTDKYNQILDLINESEVVYKASLD